MLLLKAYLVLSRLYLFYLLLFLIKALVLCFILCFYIKALLLLLCTVFSFEGFYTSQSLCTCLSRLVLLFILCFTYEHYTFTQKACLLVFSLSSYKGVVFVLNVFWYGMLLFCMKATYCSCVWSVLLYVIFLIEASLVCFILFGMNAICFLSRYLLYHLFLLSYFVLFYLSRLALYC